MSAFSKLKALMELASSNKAVEYFLQAIKDKSIKKYRKFGVVTAIKATAEQQVRTVIDGKVETTNVAHPGDYIVTGASGEKYVLTSEKMKSRYKKIADNQYEAIGECFAVKYNGKSFKFTAPWGEDMICNNGDYICSTILDGSDVYRIEKEVFKKTYKLAGK